MDAVGPLTRRSALKVVALLGAAVPAAVALLAQARERITPEALDAAEALLDHDFPDERLDVVAPALEANLHQFQVVRDLELDDAVEPPVLFVADWL